MRPRAPGTRTARQQRQRTRRARGGLLSLLILTASAASSAALEPNLPHAPKLSPAAITRAELPLHAKVAWTTHISGGLSTGGVSDTAGNIVLPTLDARIVQLDRRGRQVWQYRLPEVAASAPIMLNDGGRAVVTASGRIVVVSKQGTLLFERTLLDSGWGSLSAPANDGSFLVASGNYLVWLEASGQTRSVAHLEGNCTQVWFSQRGWVIRTQDALWTWEGVKTPRRVFRAATLTAATPLEDGSFLVADGAELLQVTPEGEQHSWLSADPGTRFEWLTRVGKASVAAKATPNLLLLVTRNGEQKRFVLGEPTRSQQSPVGLADPQGRLAAIDGSGDLHLLGLNKGEHAHLPIGCRPLTALLPGASESMIVACANGRVLGIGPEASPAPPR